MTELHHFHPARKGSCSLCPFPIYPLYTRTVILSLDKPVADCFSSPQAPYRSFPPKAAKTHSFRCVSSSHRTRFAGLRREPCSCPPQSRRNPRKSARKRLEILLRGQGHRPAPKEATQRRTEANMGVPRSVPPVVAAPGSVPLRQAAVDSVAP